MGVVYYLQIIFVPDIQIQTPLHFVCEQMLVMYVSSRMHVDCMGRGASCSGGGLKLSVALVQASNGCHRFRGLVSGLLN